MSVVKAHRSHGHLAARLDPLGAPPPGDPALAPERLNLTPELMARIPSVAAAREGAGRELRRGAPAPARGLLRHHRVRDRAPLRPPEAALAARGGRVGPDARAARAGAAPGDPRAAGRGGRLRALPAAHVPGPEDLLDRGRGRAGAHHRPGDRADGRRGHGRGRARHGPPRPAGLHHQGRGPAHRVDPGRVRGPHGLRVGRGGDARDGRRREVPPRRRGHLHHAQRPAGDREARRQPEPPGAGERGGRGPHPRPPDLPHGARPAPRPVARRFRC